MLNNDITCSLKKDVMKIVNAVRLKTKVYNINLLFTSKRFPDLRVQLCREIERITIDQDFCGNIGDKIMATLTLDRDAYVTLYYLRKDLECRMQLSEVRPDLPAEGSGCKGRKAVNESTFYMRAVIPFCENLFDKISVDRIWPDWNEKRSEVDSDRGTYKMEVELIDEKLFLARKGVLNEVFCPGTKLLDIMRFTCNVFGFSRAMIIKPDNDWTYTNFVIPPSYGVESIMSYYQNAPGLGIYKDGLISYITRWWKELDKMSWFICPRYGAPLCKNPVHVYVPGANMYLGLNQNHYIDCSGVHILVTDGINIKNWSDIGSENQITGINAQCSPTLLDGSRFLKGDDNVKAKSVASCYVSTPSDPMDMKNVVRAKYAQDHGNAFALRSSLRPPQSSDITFKWFHAQPWIFTPGTKVTLHYDHPLGYRKFEGECHKAKYTFRLDASQKLDPFWVCSAEVTLNCDNHVKYEIKPGNKSHVN